MYNFSLNPIDCLVVIIVPMIFTTFVALFGLLVNLWKPKFDWVNETVVVKQSASVTISILVTMALVFLSLLVISIQVLILLVTFMAGLSYLLLLILGFIIYLEHGA